MGVADGDIVKRQVWEVRVVAEDWVGRKGEGWRERRAKETVNKGDQKP